MWSCNDNAKSSHHITSSVTNKGGFKGVISFVYGELTIQKKGFMG